MPQITDIEGWISSLEKYKELILLLIPILLFIKKLIDLQNFDMLKLDYSLSNVNKQHKIRFRLLLKTIFNGFLFYIFLFISISFILFLSPSNTRGITIFFFIAIYFICFIITYIYTSRKTLKPYKNYLVNFSITIFLFILINLCILFLEFDKNKLLISVSSIDTIPITNYLIGRVKLIIISSIVCLLTIYDPSRSYVNLISNYSFAYFYTNDNTKLHIYSSNDQKVLCMQKPYIHYYGKNSIENKFKNFEKKVFKRKNLSALNELKEHIDNVKKYNNFINTDDIKYFFDSLYNNHTKLNSEAKIASCISEFKKIEEKLEKLNMIIEIDLSTIREFYPVINEEQNSYFK